MPRYAIFARFVEQGSFLTVETTYFQTNAMDYAKREGWSLIGEEPNDIEDVRQSEEDRFGNDNEGFWKRNLL